MVGESRDVFTKRLLVEKHVSDIMCENPKETTSLCLPLPMPMWHPSYLTSIMHGLPTITSRKFAYADDLHIMTMHCTHKW